jgi:hypothetical protein
MSAVYSDFPAASGSAESSYDITMNFYSCNIIYIELLCNCGLEGAGEALGQE